MEWNKKVVNIKNYVLFSFQSVNSLSIETRKVVKGNHSRKTAAFVRVRKPFLILYFEFVNGLVEYSIFILCKTKSTSASLFLSFSFFLCNVFIYEQFLSMLIFK